MSAAATGRTARRGPVGIVLLVGLLVAVVAVVVVIRMRRGPTYPEATPADLVEIGQGRHRLVPVARDGFLAWQAAFGATIWITDSWRSPQLQATCRQAKPTLCAEPDKSWHVKGRAVDVDLPKIGVKTPADPTYARLMAAAHANGWCRVNSKEPWHFSFGGCG